MRLAFAPIELVHATVPQTVVAADLQMRMQKPNNSASNTNYTNDRHTGRYSESVQLD